MTLKIALYFTFFLVIVQAPRIKDLKSQDVLSSFDRTHIGERPHTTKQKLNVKRVLDQGRQRTTRSIIYHTGVKICPQETLKDVLASHQAYYQLRVCQTAVWEAFRIFLDRVPSTVEYDSWISACQRESLCVTDLLGNFSRSPEHMAMVYKRLSVRDGTHLRGSVEQNPETEKDNEIKETSSVNTCGSLHSRQKVQEETEIPDATSGKHAERVLEFSISIVDPALHKPWNDTNNDQHKKIIHDLHSQLLHALVELPGFKELRVLGFRSGGGSIQCAVFFETGNRRPESAETENGTLPDPFLKGMITKALSKQSSLPVDLRSLCFDPENATDSTLKQPSTYNIDGELTASTETPTVVIDEPEISPSLVEGSDEKETDLQKLIDRNVIKENEMSQMRGHPSSTPATGEAGSAETERTGTDQQYSLVTAISRTDRVSVSKDSLASPSGAAVLGLRGNTSGTMLAATMWLLGEPITEPHMKGSTQKAVPQEEEKLTTSEPEAEKATSKIPSSHVARESITDSVASITQSAVLTTAYGQEVHGEATLREAERASLTTPPSSMDHTHKTSRPSEKALSTPTRQMTSSPGESERQDKELVLFFSLRVTNKMFSKNLFNKSSTEYRSLENIYLEMTQLSEPKHGPDSGPSSSCEPGRKRTLASIPLLPYLQSNLSGFKELEILSFRNGSMTINNKTKFARPTEPNVTEKVRCVLVDFCDGHLDVEVDGHSLDIESADHTDPCRYSACNEFSRCVVNRLTGEAECLCEPGYSSVDGLPCQSICSLQPDYCLNGGQCHIVPGHGATCRCPVGKYWHFHGERCSELVSMPVDPLLFIICLVGFLVFVLAIIGILVLINRKCIRGRRTVSLVQSRSPFSFERAMRLHPVFESEDGTLTRVSSLNCTSSTGPGSLELSEQDTLDSVENVHLSIEHSRQLYMSTLDKIECETRDSSQCVPD